MEVEKETTEMRPNIRIEIQNNLLEAMEVDEEKGSEGEEGEISDTNEPDEVNENITYLSRPEIIDQKKWSEDNGEFATGIDIFEKDEQEKLSERAKRFQLSPNEMQNFTEQQLKELYDSLGINGENEKDVRFEALHMHGTDSMSTADVLEYFCKFAPASIEWISDDSCNVVWNDRVPSARALFHLSKTIKGMPMGGTCDPFIKELDEEEQGQSILLKNKHREIEMQDEEVDKENGEVNINDITIPIPPGYWRLGVASPKSKHILLRYAMKSDKKPIRAEKFSEYYKIHGNPNFGGLKGIISESRKQQFRGIFDRNREIDEDNKNPWGSLAKNWHQDSVRVETEYREIESAPKKSQLQHRLGFKRALKSAEKEEPVKEVAEKKAKIPRMRMYADEEEEKIKRRQQLRAFKSSAVKAENRTTDLRNVLRLPARKKTEEIVNEVTDIDLGHKLKNRKLKEAAKSQEMRMRVEQHIMMQRPNRIHHRKSPVRRKENYSDYEDDYDEKKTGSKVTVVVKKQKTPAVASTVWSRIPNERERLKTVSEGKLRVRRDSSTSVSTSASSSNSDSEEAPIIKQIERPGFSSDSKSNLEFMNPEKNAMRIEIKIKNNHFRKD